MTFDTLSATCSVSPAWLTPVIVTPIVNVLKTRFSTPSNCGASTTMPGVPGPVTKPCEASVTPRPPLGWPTLLALCVRLTWKSFTVFWLSGFAISNDQSCARPVVNASKPGTFAPPCWPGYGLSSR